MSDQIFNKTFTDRFGNVHLTVTNNLLSYTGDYNQLVKNMEYVFGGKSIHICLPKDFIKLEFVSALFTSGFIPDYVYKQTDNNDYSIYYHKWTGSGKDMVPQFGTSNQGAKLMIFKVIDNELSVIATVENGQFNFPGGSCERGESAPNGAKRETMEEIGYLVENHDIFVVGGYFGGGNPKVPGRHYSSALTFFAIYLDNDTNIDFTVADNQEIQNVHYIKVKDLISDTPIYPIFESNKKILQNVYNAHLKNMKYGLKITEDLEDKTWYY